MRKITEIIIHCSETRDDQDITAKDVDNWHKQRGWDGIGYHFFIRRNGTIQLGRPIKKVGAHCKNHNANSIGICYAGGLSRVDGEKRYVDNRTPEQIRSLYLCIFMLLSIFPDIKSIVGHNKYANVACPCFDAESEYSKLIGRLQYF